MEAALVQCGDMLHTVCVVGVAAEVGPIGGGSLGSLFASRSRFWTCNFVWAAQDGMGLLRGKGQK